MHASNLHSSFMYDATTWLEEMVGRSRASELVREARFFEKSVIHAYFLNTCTSAQYVLSSD